MSRAWTTCEGCNRVLWVEDGPICPECKEKEPQLPPPKRDEANAELPKKDAAEGGKGMLR